MTRQVHSILAAAAVLLIGGGLALAQHQHEPPTPVEIHEADAAPAVEYTLKEVMQHLAQSQAAIDMGLLANNRLMVQHGADAILNHPSPKGGIAPYIKKNIEQLQAQIQAMDQQVHGSARLLSAQAATAPMAELHAITTRMVAGCIGCHDVFRD